jgi:hypothetical protein
MATSMGAGAGVPELIGTTPMDMLGQSRETLEREYDALIARSGDVAVPAGIDLVEVAQIGHDLGSAPEIPALTLYVEESEDRHQQQCQEHSKHSANHG